MHACRTDLRHRQQGAGKLALFRAPIGGIEHLRGGGKTRQLIQQFIAARPRRGQPFRGKAHAQAVALGRVDIDRGAPHLVQDPALFQRGHDLARGGGFQPGVEQRHLGPSGQTAQRKDCREHRQRSPDDDDFAAQVEGRPGGDHVLQGDSPHPAVLPVGQRMTCAA